MFKGRIEICSQKIQDISSYPREYFEHSFFQVFQIKPTKLKNTYIYLLLFDDWMIFQENFFSF